MKLFMLSIVVLMLAGCGSSLKRKSSSIDDSTPPPVVNLAEPDGSQIDYISLQNTLVLDRSSEELGFAEKPFNTCEVGSGYSSTHNCQHMYFTVINFRLLCRDTEGTVSTVLMDDQLTPIAGKSIKWVIKDLNGVIETDDRGYGQIRAVSAASQKKQRLKLSLGDEFLYVHANEITKITTPKPWCDQVVH